MPAPLIGISVSAKFEPDAATNLGTVTLGWNYAQGVLAAGGIPIAVLPKTDPVRIANLIDGWLIPGGEDIDPALYGQLPHPKTVILDRGRYDSEVALYRALPNEMPVLGICYGCQFLNIQRGGSLCQHVPDVVGHEEHTGGTLAPYRLEAGGLLARAVGAEVVDGRSYHHQAIERVGEGLRATAFHADGTIEGIEAVDRTWMVATQWHPERTLDDPATKRLFRAFVEAATAYRATANASA